MKKIALAAILTSLSLTGFAQISCSKLFETSDALKDGSIEGRQINKDTLESTFKLDGQIESYIINWGDTSRKACFIFLRTNSETEAINKYKELKELLERCKPFDWGKLNSERAYSILISTGFYITANYYGEAKENPEYTVLISITLNRKRNAEINE